MKSLVTIGLPFFNNVATLEDSIKSIFAQTFDKWELLLVDDGSTDGSLQIAKNIKDPRVKIVSDGLNRGLVYRLNQIARMANTKYVARMDADDLMHPERLASQIEYLEDNKETDLVDCAVYSMNLDGHPEGIRGMSPISLYHGAALGKTLLIHATVVGKTDWFKENPYDPDFLRGEDYELWCRTYMKSKFARIQKPLYFVREGLVDINNYLLGAKTTRRVFRVYGKDFVGKFGVSFLVFKSLFKSGVYILFGWFGVHDRLVRRRNRVLSENEFNSATKILLCILSTKVPVADLSKINPET